MDALALLQEAQEQFLQQKVADSPRLYVDWLRDGKQEQRGIVLDFAQDGASDQALWIFAVGVRLRREHARHAIVLQQLCLIGFLSRTVNHRTYEHLTAQEMNFLAPEPYSALHRVRVIQKSGEVACAPVQSTLGEGKCPHLVLFLEGFRRAGEEDSDDEKEPAYAG